uniref:hypothetical protein n=1 Tax=Verrucosispora sioxanthis TaxID=2499994 RepID=UPI0035A177AF
MPFAALLTRAIGYNDRLASWIAEAKATDLPHLHTVIRGLGLDRAAVDAALTHPPTSAAPKALTPEPN